MGVLVWSFSTLLSALIGVVLTVLFQDRISEMAIRVSGSLLTASRTRSISGKWYTYWEIIPDPGTSSTASSPHNGIDIIQFRRVGNRVVGKDQAKGYTYAISAALASEAFLTGTWQDFTRNQHQWGSFQMYWEDSGWAMVGKFLGKDRNNHVNHGVWLWAREPEELPGLASWAKEVAGYDFDLQRFAMGIKDGLARLSSQGEKVQNP